MRSLTLKTLPGLMVATLVLTSVPAWAQDPGMAGDLNPTWQHHPDGSTTGWQGDTPQPVQTQPCRCDDRDDGQWANHHHHSGYTNDGHGDGAMRVQRQGDVTFVSGGVGLDESRLLLREGRHYPLMLTFLGRNREYLADVRVRIVDANGDEVLGTHAQGPYLLARLPAGRYTVQAAYHGREQARSLWVSARGHTGSTFVWATRDQ